METPRICAVALASGAVGLALPIVVIVQFLLGLFLIHSMSMFLLVLGCSLALGVVATTLGWIGLYDMRHSRWQGRAEPWMGLAGAVLGMITIMASGLVLALFYTFSRIDL